MNSFERGQNLREKKIDRWRVVLCWWWFSVEKYLVTGILKSGCFENIVLTYWIFIDIVFLKFTTGCWNSPLAAETHHSKKNVLWWIVKLMNNLLFSFHITFVTININFLYNLSDKLLPAHLSELQSFHKQIKNYENSMKFEKKYHWHVVWLPKKIEIFSETLHIKNPDFRFIHLAILKMEEYFYGPLKHLRVLFEWIYVLIFFRCYKNSSIQAFYGMMVIFHEIFTVLISPISFFSLPS